MFYCTPLLGFYFTFPSRYYFTIGHPRVFSLTRWSSLIHTGFHVPHATRDKKIAFKKMFNYRTFTVYGAGFSCFVFIFALNGHDYLPTTPVTRFRLFPLRSPLLRESRLLSLPPLTKMFQFSGLLLADL